MEELRVLNEELHERTVELERAIGARSRFYANMSHELRTPINAILGYSSLLLEKIFGPLTEQQVSSIERTHKAGTHLLELVNDILDLSKIEAGKMELQIETVRFPDVIDDLFVTMAPFAEQHGVVLDLETESEPFTIVSDAAQAAADPPEPLLERHQVRRGTPGESGLEPHRRQQRPRGGERSGRRHPAGGPGEDLRGVRAARPRSRDRRNGVGSPDLPPTRGAARRYAHGRVSAGTREHLPPLASVERLLRRLHGGGGGNGEIGRLHDAHREGAVMNAREQTEWETLQAEIRSAVQHQRAAYEQMIETQAEVEALLARARSLLAIKETGGAGRRSDGTTVDHTG
jgi:hypothetical protein